MQRARAARIEVTCRRCGAVQDPNHLKPGKAYKCECGAINRAPKKKGPPLPLILGGVGALVVIGEQVVIGAEVVRGDLVLSGDAELWSIIALSLRVTARRLEGDAGVDHDILSAGLAGHLCDGHGVPVGGVDTTGADEPDEVQTNGLSFSMAHGLTAPFIVHPAYGTRCSTVLTIDDAGNVRFLERSFGPDGRPGGDAKFVFESGGQDAE